MQRNLTAVLYAIIGIGALAGLYGGLKRYQVESYNKRVELALEYTELKTLADVTGRPLKEVLFRFREAGITSVAITEDTLASLETRGAIHPRLFGGGVIVEVDSSEVDSPGLVKRISQALIAKGVPQSHDERDWERPVTRFVTSGNSFGPRAGFKSDYPTLRTLGIGLYEDSVKDITAARLQPVARITNWPGVSPNSMKDVLASLKFQGIKTVVFQGTEVLGFRGQHKEAAGALQAAGLNYGQVEFGKQKGDEKLSVALKGEYVRVHSISDQELGMLDENEAIDRFVRAARERNVRLCYIRLPFFSGSDPIGLNVEFLGKITRAIARGSEMSFGVAHTFRETEVPNAAFLLMGLGAGAGLALLLVRVVPMSAPVTGAVCIAFTLSCGVLAFVGGESGRKLAALSAAMAFPTIACLHLDLLNPTDRGRAVMRASSAAAQSIKILIRASAVTAVGIAIVVGLLATRPFMLKANQFLGIKAAHAIPILVIGLLAIVGLPRIDRPWTDSWAAMKNRAGRFLGEPTRAGQLLLAIAALIALAFIVARTGNDPGVGVSGIELKFRALLDRFLPVRPRTKEFLIGHPAFVLGLALWFRGRRKWALPLFVVGVIGQVSLLNTFCHIHTPLVLSLIRDVTGLVMGTVIGLAIFWFAERLSGPPGSAPAPEPAGG